MNINWGEVEPSDIPDDLKAEIIRLADAEKVMLLRLGIYPEDFVDADPKRIHDCVYLPKCKVNIDEGIVWFSRQKVGNKDAEKWLYYIGAEDEADVLWMDGENLLYHNISESRLRRFEPDDTGNKEDTEQ